MGLVPPGLRIRSGETGEQMCAMLLGFTQSWATGFANWSGESLAWRCGKVSICWSKGWVLSTAQSGPLRLSHLCSSWMILRSASAQPAHLSSRELQKYPQSMSTASKLWARVIAGCWAVCLHVGALASRSAWEAVFRSVVSKAGIWAWGIPQNCHIGTVSINYAFKSWAAAPWPKGLACAVTQLSWSTATVLSFDFWTLLQTLRVNAMMWTCSVQSIFCLIPFKSVDKIWYSWI